MSAPPTTNPPAPNPTIVHPEPTPADHDAAFASVVWYRTQRETGAFEPYAGKHVAILGVGIIDADADPDALTRRLEARAGALPLNRVVVQYVPGPDDLGW